MNLIARPRFRTDLVAEPIEEDGHRYIDVVDPDTGAAFRFYDVEYSIACAMDGMRDVSGLAEWAKEELGIEPSPRELTTVISTLGDLGYLEGVTTAPAEAEAAYQPEVVRGVVAPAPAAPPRAPAVELGQAGARPRAEVPLRAPEVELGRPGGRVERSTPVGGPLGERPDLGPPGRGMEFETPTPPPAEQPSPKLRPITTRPVRDMPEMEDGPTNLPPAMAADFSDDEVSVDLSTHLPISASDVKEAVRASKVMRTVDLPPDVQAALDGADAQADEARRAAERATAEREGAERAAQEAAARAAQERAAQEAATRAAAERAAQEAARPAVELPRPPVGRPPLGRPEPIAPTAAPVEQPVPAKRGVPVAVIVLLLLAVVVAAAYFIWTSVLDKPLPWQSAEDTTAAPAPVAPSPAEVPAPQPQPPAPPPPPAPPSATLAESAATPTDVVAPQIGQIADIVPEGKTVAVGDQVLRFVGNPALDQRLQGLDYDITIGVPRQIEQHTKAKEAAEKAGNPARAKAAEAKLEERTRRLEEKRQERDEILKKLEGSIVKAPVGGKVSLKAKKGERTKPDQVVAVITPAPVLNATFDVPAGKTYTVDAAVDVKAKADEAKTASCRVSAVDGTKVTVECPPDGGLAAGTEIILP